MNKYSELFIRLDQEIHALGKILSIFYTALINRNLYWVIKGNKDNYCLQNEKEIWP